VGITNRLRYSCRNAIHQISFPPGEARRHDSDYGGGAVIERDRLADHMGLPPNLRRKTG
jgi:hypothetical protein